MRNSRTSTVSIFCLALGFAIRHNPKSNHDGFQIEYQSNRVYDNVVFQWPSQTESTKVIYSRFKSNRDLDFPITDDFKRISVRYYWRSYRLNSTIGEVYVSYDMTGVSTILSS